MKKTIIFLLSFLMTFGFVHTASSATNLVSIKHSTNSGNIKYRGTSTDVKMVETYTEKTDEFRGVWVSTVSNIDIAKHTSQEQYKAALNKIMDNMELWGLNAMIFQVRPMNDAFYQSQYNDYSTYFTKNDPGWNMLEWLITECHARGFEFHAWFNPYRVNNSSSLSLEDVAKQYKSTNAASNIKNLLKCSSGTILNPGEPAVRSFVLDSIMEVVRNYDIDAVHFDDYFYREFNSSSSYLDDPDVATYTKYTGSAPTSNTQMADWRREQVNLMINAVHTSLQKYNKENNKAVQFGISPTGVYRNGNRGLTINDSNYDVNSGSNTAGQEHYESYLFADSLHWIKQGWLDYILPQTYWGLEETAAPFADVVSYWAKALENKKTKLYIAHGVYREESVAAWQNPINEVENEFKFGNQFDTVVGHSFFSYKSLANATASSKPVTYTGIEKMKTELFKTKSLGVPHKAFESMVRPAVNKIKQTGADSNTYSYDSLNKDVIRGYVIYKTPKGNTVNKTTDIFKITTETQIDLNDLTNFDYYISTLNLGRYTGEITKLNISYSEAPNAIINQINNLPALNNISISNRDQIKLVRMNYDILEEDQKTMVTNYNTFLEIEAKLDTLLIQYIINGTAKLSTVTMDNEKTVLDLKENYDFLSEINQGKITNSDKLLEAFNYVSTTRTKVDKLIADIDEIKTVTAEKADFINELSTTYNSLDISSKKLITNYTTLANAIKTLNTLTAVINIVNRIDNLNEEVDYSMKGTIDQLLIDFNALTSAQKSQVTNYRVLASASLAIDKLQEKIDNLIKDIENLGDIFYYRKNLVLELYATYNTFDEAMKLAVTNYNTLSDAKKIIDDIDDFIIEVNAYIIALGEVKIEDEAKITELLNKYNSLDSTAVTHIENIEILQEALNTINALKNNSESSSCSKKQDVNYKDLILSLILCGSMLVSIPIILKKK